MLSSRPVHFNSETPYFPTKTPGRGLKSNRIENAHAGFSMTVNRQGKDAQAPKTPFQPSSVQPQRLFKDQKPILFTTSRPLGDKTPLPNRLGGLLLLQTPAAQKQSSKLSKLSFADQATQNQTIDEGQNEGGTPASIQRPSSMRRSKLPGGGRKSESFQTPMNQGNHWDVSDGDIVLDTQPMLTDTTMELVDGDDEDEVEYCAPNTLDLPYQPPFDFELPNYTELGNTLRELAFSVPIQDHIPPPEPEIAASEIEPPLWNLLQCDEPAEDIDDPFYQARLELEQTAKANVSRARATAPFSGRKPISVGKPTPSLRPRPQSALSKPRPAIPSSASGPSVKLSRPATSASVYPSGIRATSTSQLKPTASRVPSSLGISKPSTSSSRLASTASKASSSTPVIRKTTLVSRAPAPKAVKSTIPLSTTTTITRPTIAKAPQSSLAVQKPTTKKIAIGNSKPRAGPLEDLVLAMVELDGGIEDFVFDV